MTNIYSGIDPRNLPNYDSRDVARYLRISKSTLNEWIVGNSFLDEDDIHFFPSVIVIPDNQNGACNFSFNNLIEVHILRALHEHHNMKKITKALYFVQRNLNIPHPLTSNKFRTDVVALFAEKYGKLTYASKSTITDLKDRLNMHLDRISYDYSGFAVQLYPFTRSCELNNPKTIVIDPRIAFGRLSIVNTGIPVTELKQRFLAGDTIEELAVDYNCDLLSIEEAIRCEYM